MAAAREVGLGLASHLRADAVFHRHPAFHERMDLLRPRVRELWPGARDPELVAHVLIEMLLDRWLMAGDSTLLTRYYGAFRRDQRDFAASMAASDEASRAALGEVLERFVSSRMLVQYGNADGLVARLVRALGRIPRFFRDPPVESRLAERVDAWSREIEGGFDELLGFVRAALQKERATVRPA
jgi:hypothetical protein